VSKKSYTMEEKIRSLLSKASNSSIKQEIVNLTLNVPFNIELNSIVENHIHATMHDSSASYQKQFAIFDSVLDFVWEKLNTGHWCSIENSWRKLHTILSILKVRTLMYFINNKKIQNVWT